MLRLWQMLVVWGELRHYKVSLSINFITYEKQSVGTEDGSIFSTESRDSGSYFRALDKITSQCAFRRKLKRYIPHQMPLLFLYSFKRWIGQTLTSSCVLTWLMSSRS